MTLQKHVSNVIWFQLFLKLSKVKIIFPVSVINIGFERFKQAGLHSYKPLIHQKTFFMTTKVTSVKYVVVSRFSPILIDVNCITLYMCPLPYAHGFLQDVPMHIEL